MESFRYRALGCPGGPSVTVVQVDLTADRKASGRPPGKTNLRRTEGDPERRAELLDIAIRVIAEKGLPACTFRTLAREAGASTMTYTYEFGNRDSLLQAVLRRCSDHLWEQRRLFEDEGDDPLGRLRELAMSGSQLEEGINPALRAYDHLLIAAPTNEAIAETLKETDSRILDRYREIIRHAQELGQIPSTIDPDDLCWLIWSMGDGLTLQRFAHPDLFPPERVKRLFLEAFDSLVTGHSG